MTVEELKVRCNIESYKGDSVSRQAVIEIIDRFDREEMRNYLKSIELEPMATSVCYDAVNAVGDIKEKVLELPSIERQKGEWKYEHREDCFAGYYCSICDRYVSNPISFNYCPNCGADMRGNGTDDKRRDTESI